MTDLREVMARLVDPKLFDDHAPHPWPYLLDEERNAAISVAGDYLRAIEAAGYAVVKKEPDCITPVVAETSNATISEEDKRFSAQATSYAASFLKSYSDTFDAVGARTLEKAFDAMDAASPPLAKET